MGTSKGFWNRVTGLFYRSDSEQEDGAPLNIEGGAAIAAECESRIGYTFNDKQLLLNALTHSSRAQHRLASNERLEFLGDAVLGMMVTEWLFHNFPRYQEGELTRIKSVVVSRKTCARIAHRLGLESLLQVGKGIALSGEIPESMLANVTESLLAAIYLDGGPEAALEFMDQYVVEEIANSLQDGVPGNYKSQLQQIAQRDLKETPVYEVIKERGPDHQKEFEIIAVIAGVRYSSAWGASKKQAEQKAALNALMELGVVDRNEEDE